MCVCCVSVLISVLQNKLVVCVHQGDFSFLFFLILIFAFIKKYTGRSVTFDGPSSLIINLLKRL